MNEGSSAGRVSAETVTSFKQFVQQAAAALGRGLDPKEKISENEAQYSAKEFESFISRAKPLVIHEIRQTLLAHRPTIERIGRWLIPESCDTIAAAGLVGDEDSYTNLIAWLLYPQQYPRTALKLQQAWIEALGRPDIAAQMKEAAIPKTQFHTKDGRPDLVLHLEEPSFVLVVEAKTQTSEHETPAGCKQTEGYLKAVLRQLGLPEDHKGVMIYLTQNLEKASDQMTVNTTYQTLMTTIAGSLSQNDFNPELRLVYASVITHFLTYAAPGGVNAVTTLRNLAGHMRHEKVDLTDDYLLSNLRGLGSLCDELRGGGSL